MSIIQYLWLIWTERTNGYYQQSMSSKYWNIIDLDYSRQMILLGSIAFYPSRTGTGTRTPLMRFTSASKCLFFHDSPSIHRRKKSHCFSTYYGVSIWSYYQNSLDISSVSQMSYDNNRMQRRLFIRALSCYKIHCRYGRCLILGDLVSLLRTAFPQENENRIVHNTPYRIELNPQLSISSNHLYDCL